MASTGRTTSKWIDFRIDGSDTSHTLRSIPISSINGVGLDYDIVDLTAFQDVLKNFQPGFPACNIDITGPYDTSAVAAAGTMSGSHTVLHDLPGKSTPLTLDVQIGIKSAWDAGEPQFGITGTAANGFLCKSYSVDMNNSSYAASFYPISGSAAPAFGTAAET